MELHNKSFKVGVREGGIDSFYLLYKVSTGWVLWIILKASQLFYLQCCMVLLKQQKRGLKKQLGRDLQLKNQTDWTDLV